MAELRADSVFSKVLNQWSVRNAYIGGVYNGKTTVPEMRVTMTFPDALEDGDVIVVRSFTDGESHLTRFRCPALFLQTLTDLVGLNDVLYLSACF